MTKRAETEPGLPQHPGCKFNDLLIEGFGVGGKNGRVGNMEKRMKRLEHDLAGVKAVQFKLIIWVSLAAGGSTAAVGTAFQIISG